MQVFCNLRNCEKCRDLVSLKVLSYYKDKNGDRKCSENELYCIAHAAQMASKQLNSLTISYATFTELKRDETENKEPDDKVIPVPGVEKEVYDTVGECAG